jgi:hypothetical protein
VPAEVTRLTWRLRPRDWWFIGLVACASVAAGTWAIVAAPGPNTDPNCLTANRVTFTGGGTFLYCDGEAVAFCRRFAPGNQKLAAKCDELPFAWRP